MTTRNATGPAGAEGDNPWRREFFALMTIGAPMALTQLVQFSINTIDVIMIGKLGPEALAGAALGLVIVFALYLFGFGPAMAVAPMVSQALGADRENVDDVRRSVRMGLWALIILMPILCLILFFTEEIALALGQPAGPASLAEPYVLAFAPGILFSLVVMALRNFLAAIERARAPLYIVAATTALNAFLNWVLIYGNLGAPSLELVGAGIASSLSNFAGLAAIIAYVRLEKESRRFTLFADFLRPDWARFREIAQLAWPIGFAMIFEAMLFNAAVYLMGRIGINEVAAYQVALNVAALAFMAPMGIAMAGGVRVGLMAGARDGAGVRRAAAVTLLCAIAAIMAAAVPMLLMPHAIASLYLNALDPANAAVLALVASFLPVAAMFALFDATQVAAAQALRGLKDVRAPMAITFVSYWLIGFTASALLGLKTPLGAVGVWYGLLAGLAAAATLLGARLWLLTRPSKLFA